MWAFITIAITMIIPGSRNKGEIARIGGKEEKERTRWGRLGDISFTLDWCLNQTVDSWDDVFHAGQDLFALSTC